MLCRHLASAHPLCNLPAPVQAGQCHSSPGALWEAIFCHNSAQHPSQTTSGKQQPGWGGAPVPATYPSVACPNSNLDVLEPSRASAASFSGASVPSSPMYSNTQNGVSGFLMRTRLARTAGRCGKQVRPQCVGVWANLCFKHPHLARNGSHPLHGLKPLSASEAQ